MRKILMTDTDYEQLDLLLEAPSHALKKSGVLKEFKAIFLTAVAMPQHSISRRVITLGTTVKLKDFFSNDETEVVLVYPNEVNDDQRSVSVFSDMGIALLGSSLGEVVTWPSPNGVKQFLIADVTHA